MAHGNLYDVRQKLKIAFLAVSLLLVALFLIISNRLVEDLSTEEHNKMEIWAEATRSAASNVTNVDMNLILKILQSNTTIPIIIADDQGQVLQTHNLEIPNRHGEQFLQKKLQSLRDKEQVIEIYIDNDTSQYLYYDDSTLLKRLSYFPYIQLGVMILFLVIAYVALMSSKKAEQNKVWVGLSKETAHQLGTPLSSLMAWLDMLESQGTDPEIIDDMGKDVQRLSTIAERFSKIGSQPEREPADVKEVIDTAVDYMQHRISGKVHITMHTPEEKLEPQPLCRPLIEWVFENLCKNAIDAMDGEGNIDITLTHDESRYYIDVKDTGKGIARNRFKTIFHPGYTTKRRGWGLGLTLVKRIIEEYHNGRIYVKESEIGKGTTFRIEMKRT
ncbi:MAG TPA: HAMP domain-containing histidine kinase [Candidatus Caccoplasma merdavium]|nr:HAMP domain-containing histidine kinase [Candidatus Caccoplasma merdavium]